MAFVARVLMYSRGRAQGKGRCKTRNNGIAELRNNELQDKWKHIGADASVGLNSKDDGQPTLLLLDPQHMQFNS